VTLRDTAKIWLTSLSMINSGTPVLLAILTAPLIISESQVEVCPGFESTEAACAGGVALTPKQRVFDFNSRQRDDIFLARATSGSIEA
jgi:hypothetical protein